MFRSISSLAKKGKVVPSLSFRSSAMKNFTKNATLIQPIRTFTVNPNFHFQKDLEDLVKDGTLRGRLSHELLDDLKSSNKISSVTHEALTKEVDKMLEMEENGEKWAKSFYYLGIPLIIAAAINAYFFEKEENEHWDPYFEDYVPYPYLRLRHSRKYFFGDGDHTLFHNPRYNYDPVYVAKIREERDAKLAAAKGNDDSGSDEEHH